MTTNNNDLPGDWHLLKAWMPFIRRLRKEYDHAPVTVITARIILDARGNPVVWSEPESFHLEPGASAEQGLRSLLDALTGTDAQDQ